MNNLKFLIAFVCAAGFAGLAGCAAKTRYPNYYVLNPPAPVMPQAKAVPVFGSVAVREFRAPGFLTGGEIVYRESGEQLGFYHYHHWAEDPRRVVTAAMIRELEARGLFESVSLFDGRGAPACVMSGTLDHLEEVDNGASVSIDVGLSATLRNSSSGEVIWHGSASQTAKVDKRSVPGIVTEMSRSLGKAVEELVSSIESRASAGAAEQ